MMYGRYLSSKLYFKYGIYHFLQRKTNYLLLNKTVKSIILMHEKYKIMNTINVIIYEWMQ